MDFNAKLEESAKERVSCAKERVSCAKERVSGGLSC